MVGRDPAPTLLREAPAAAGPVECLGLTFESEAARRGHFLERLKAALPELRRRPDFPAAADEDVLRLSDPPYYTACPNPFLAEFVERHGRPYDAAEPYRREPFAVDVSVGKTDPLYRAHGYHTKVPHRAIVPSILHYTRPGDLVLDGFCGSGMTGVAAQWCGTAPPEYRRGLEKQWAAEGRAAPAWGARRAVLGDLSPAAAFIAGNYNLPFDVDAFARAARALLDDAAAEVGWMYETRHGGGTRRGRIDYTVWSEVFACPECAGEIVFIDEALDAETGRTRKEFSCPHCGAALGKKTLERSFETLVDSASRAPRRRIRLRPAAIVYTADGARHRKPPDAADLATLDRIAGLPLPPEVPTDAFPIDVMYHGSRLAPKGFTHVHHLFLPRAAHALAALWRRAAAHEDPRLRNVLLFFVEQAIVGMSVLNRYQPVQHGRPGGSQVNRQLSGVYYVGSQIAECAPDYNLKGRLRVLASAFKSTPSEAASAFVSTGDCSRIAVEDSAVDYIFTDPPFGENIYYADLNFLVESWHRTFTRTEPEAIVDRRKDKALIDYQRLMQRCFDEYRRVLKPGRWMTVVFHNSRSAVWNAIQEAMLAAGFVVADVRTLDKLQGSYRQVTSTAVKQDLVISAYKPNHGLEERFKLAAGTEDGVWDFVRTHFRQLPVFVSRDERAEVIAERQGYLLFDRMVAFHVLRGVTVPLSSAEFHAGLAQRFPERDGMFFLPEQIAEYDRKRLAAQDVVQLELFVRNEETAIRWLQQELGKKPETFQEIHPRFIRELGGWMKHERMIELSDLLEQNFLCCDGRADVPDRVRAWLSGARGDLRNLESGAPALRRAAKDRWYVPDPHKAADLEILRTRALLREFDEYRDGGRRRLRLFRLEAVRAGFRRAWQEGDYAAIIEVAERIPENVLQEDPKLLMWYDQALTRIEQEGSGDS